MGWRRHHLQYLPVPSPKQLARNRIQPDRQKRGKLPSCYGRPWEGQSCRVARAVPRGEVGGARERASPNATETTRRVLCIVKLQVSGLR